MLNELKDKKILVIVESPNKVAHIKEYLNKAGYKDLRVQASVGHISEIRNGGSYWNTGIEPDEDFKMDLAISEDKRDVVNKLKASVEWADIVYLATDGDNEGEQISWSLIKFLKLPKSKYKRMITHEITPKAVVCALENPVPFNEAKAMASQARMILDKITGYRLSPIAKNYIGAKSVGRCQSAGLKIIVDREKEIQNFKPEKYFDIYLNFKKNSTEFKAKYVGTDTKAVDHLKTKAEVDKVIKECNSDYIVKNITNRNKEESPKPPFCTATFQQEVNSKLGLSVKDSMSIAQKLFEEGKITYMRTDDSTMSDEFIVILKDYIQNVFGKKSYVSPRVGKKQEGAQEGHECLRVTDPALTPEVFNKSTSNQLYQKVYKIIWQRTVASALPNAIISETIYSIYNNEHKFTLTSNELASEGYKKVYSYKDDDEEDTGLVKETFTKDEVLTNTKLNPLEKATTPPARFKEATFIKELQKKQIGRPSTFATIVETVLSTSRGYCELDNKYMVPTARGIQLIEFLDRSFSNLINLNYTKDMEKDLDLIAEGKLEKLAFLKTFYETLENTIKASPEIAQATKTETVLCPKCGKQMVLRRSKFGSMFYGCSQYPKCNGIVSIK